MELQALLLQEVLGHGNLHLEPMGRPAGPERGANLGGREGVARCFLEERARLTRRRVHGELDMFGVGTLHAGFVELAGAVSSLIVTAACDCVRTPSGLAHDTDHYP